MKTRQQTKCSVIKRLKSILKSLHGIQKSLIGSYCNEGLLQEIQIITANLKRAIMLISKFPISKNDYKFYHPDLEFILIDGDYLNKYNSFVLYLISKNKKKYKSLLKRFFNIPQNLSPNETTDYCFYEINKWR